MDRRAQKIINQVDKLTSEFGVPVNINRYSKNVPSANQDAFGQPTNPDVPQPFTVNVIIEDQSTDLMTTIIGGKPKEVLKLIASTGLFQNGDEVTYSGHTYKVDFLNAVNFIATNVVDFVHATREVD